MISLNKNKLANSIFDGADSLISILSGINPVLAGITIIIFAIRQVINYTSSDDIIRRFKKLDEQLNSKKIDMEVFKTKLSKLSEHNIYIAKNNLNNILLNCIPESVDIYISLWIDFILNDNNSVYEELCEILTSLNKNDLVLLEMIKSFTKYGEKKYYISSEMSKKLSEQENAKIKEERKKYNSETNGIKKLEFDFSGRDVIMKDKTIFWKDFSDYCGIQVGEMGYMLLDEGINKNGEKAMDGAYFARSFIKLERLGVLQLDYFNTLGTINSLNIDRFHITLFGEKLLEYIPLEKMRTL